MKKIVFLFVVGLFLVVGCGSNGNKVVCTGTQGEDVKVDMKMEALLKDGKVSSVSATMKVDDETTAQQFCNFLSLANNTVTENGKNTIDYECNGKEIKIKNYETVAASEDEKIVGLSKADFIKAMEEEALTCK